jgi:hypothetical protein
VGCKEGRWVSEANWITSLLKGSHLVGLKMAVKFKDV